jgi:hypothetical protein
MAERLLQGLISTKISPGFDAECRGEKVECVLGLLQISVTELHI